MSRKGKIGLSVFALAVLMLVIGIAASGKISGTAAVARIGASANAPSGASNVAAVDDSFWSQKPPEKTLPNGVRVVQEVKHDISPPLKDIPPAADIPNATENENPNPLPVV